MEALRQKAHEKMLTEMQTAKSQITERLHVFLCNTDDEELLNAILKEDRTLEKATEYCYAQGSKLAHKGVADVSAEQEINWCKEYYLKESVTDNEFKILPPEKGEQVIVEKEVIKEVKEVIYETPTADAIAEYLAQQKKASKPKEKTTVEQESLF